MATPNHEPATINEVLEVRGIEKSFFGVRVLKGVNLHVGKGRIIGLVGENGAGKSTLMNILGGNVRADVGEMLWAGQRYDPRHPTDAAAAGIAFVHQELNLFPNLSIAENIFLNSFPCRGTPFIARGELRTRTAKVLAQVGLKISADTLVQRLPAGERQLVEIARALSVSPRLLILDEPTTSLSGRETEQLFSLISTLKAGGTAIIYISHILGDVLRLCDDIVVLRDGEVVGSGPRAELTGERMISLMVGRSLNQLYPTRAGVVDRGSVNRRAPGGADAPRLTTRQPEGHALLELRAVTQPHIVRNISFALSRGEVLGISGLMGAGRSELARILFGLDPYAAGEILLNGRPLSPGGPRERIRQGLAFVTEDRRDEGLCLEASVADNLALAGLRRHARAPLRLLSSSWRDAVRSMRDAVRLSSTARNEQPVKTLSGGNQQKVVLGKWLMAEPQVFILDEPTRGIDVGAKFEIYQLIHQLADRGAGVLVISSEMEELIGICDRILVMNQGEIRDELLASEFDRERLLRAALLEGTRVARPEAGAQ